MFKSISSISLQHFTTHWLADILSSESWLFIYLFAPSLLSMLICISSSYPWSPLSMLPWSQEIGIYVLPLSFNVCFCSANEWHWQELRQGKSEEVRSPWLPSSFADWGSCTVPWMVNSFQGMATVFPSACLYVVQALQVQVSWYPALSLIEFF